MFDKIYQEGIPLFFRGVWGEVVYCLRWLMVWPTAIVFLYLLGEVSLQFYGLALVLFFAFSILNLGYSLFSKKTNLKVAFAGWLLLVLYVQTRAADEGVYTRTLVVSVITLALFLYTPVAFRYGAKLAEQKERSNERRQRKEDKTRVA